MTTDLYKRAQQTAKTRGTSGVNGKAPRHTAHPYLFRGLITGGLCGRQMVGNPNHGRLYYRCAASRDYVRQHGISHPPVLYLLQDAIADPVDRLCDELRDHNLMANLRDR